MFFPEKSINWCAQYIIDSSRDKNGSQLINLYIWVYSCELDLPSDFAEIFFKLMTAYFQYVLMYKQNSEVFCVLNKQNICVTLTDSGMDGKVPVFFAGPLRLELVNRSNQSMVYDATWRNGLRLKIMDDNKILFDVKDKIKNPLIFLGEGSYGSTFKIMGTDGKTYVIKVFKDKKSAEDEWTFLAKITRKHKCIQNGVMLMIDQLGYFKNFIISEYQGEMVLSKLKTNKNKKITLQGVIRFLLEMGNGLHVMHLLGFIHGDIKPENIVLGLNWNYMFLIDFGIATRFGENPLDPDSLYTWRFRFPRLFLEKKMMKAFNTKLSTIIHPTEPSPEMDFWAFFVSILATLAQPSHDFLGFCSMDEEKARKELFDKSSVIFLMTKLKPWLTDERGMSFVQKIYWVLFKSGGSDNFIQVFREFGIDLSSGEAMYNEYLRLFNKWRDENPMKMRVQQIFVHIVCEDPNVDISGIIQELGDLFIEIICDGADFSLLGFFNTHVSGWLLHLRQILSKMNALNKRIIFY
jgi:serine/threonine protein kinase